MLDDPYTVRLEFDDEFAPENNDEIRKIIEQVSESEENENVAPLNQTLPFATFNTAEDFHILPFGNLIKHKKQK